MITGASFFGAARRTNPNEKEPPMAQEKAADPKGEDQAKSNEIPDAGLDKVSGGIVTGTPVVGPKTSGFNTTGDTIRENSFGGDEWDRK